MKRYLIRHPDGKLSWAAGLPSGARVICELPTPCPKCATSGGLMVWQSGQVNCAECQKLLREAQNKG